MVDLVWQKYLYDIVLFKMIKILETLNEEINYSELTNTLYNIEMDGLTIKNVNVKNLPSPDVWKVGLDFQIELTKLSPDTINIFYPKVVDVLIQNGHSSNLDKFFISVSSIVFKYPPYITVVNSHLPTVIINHLRYDDPRASEVYDGDYSLVLPRNILMDIDEYFETIVKSKRKSSEVFYKLYKKGNVDGYNYELSDNPKIKITLHKNNIVNPRDFNSEIESFFKSIDDIPITDTVNYPGHLHWRISEKIESFFKKHNIVISIHY
jgi:hypothetical protein